MSRLSGIRILPYGKLKKKHEVENIPQKKEMPEPTFTISNPEAIEKAQYKVAQFYANIYFKHEEEILKSIRKKQK